MDADAAPAPTESAATVLPDDDLWEALEAAGDPLEPAVEEAVALAGAGAPVAVVGAPFGGRERVLARVADRLGARQPALTPSDGAPSLGGATVLDDAHHLYHRAVGGFDPLDTFLERVADAEVPLVTGWNRHAWSYCKHARDVEAGFEAVAVPAVGREHMGALVESWSPYVTFRAPPAEARGLLGTERRTVSLPVLGPREVTVPTVDPSALERRDPDEDPEAAVVDRLTALSDGNPGVARALWRTCVAGRTPGGSATVDPTDLRTPVERADEVAREREQLQRERGTGDAGTPMGADTAGTDRRTAFCCRLVLAGERLPRAVLRGSVRDADRLLGRLARRGYLTLTEGTVQLRPAAVPDAVTLTEGRRIP